jgi:hypothetical protein
VGRVDREQPIQHFDGMIMLVPAAAGGKSDQVWPAAHYGIQYLLRVERGVLMGSSKLWMGALLFTADLPDDRLHEWLSWRPLPEIPPGFVHVSETDQGEATNEPTTRGANTSDK